MTPATTPANLASVFAQGFGAGNLLTNSFRLSYLQDSINNPDGGFPTTTTGAPPTAPPHPLRQALKTNDQRAWTPTAPMLLCAGNMDPTVLYLNTELMQRYWASATTVTVLDIDSDSKAATHTQRRRLSSRLRRISSSSVADDEVLETYHGPLVAPFCLSATKSFFDGF